MTIARRITFVFLVSLFWSGQLAAQTGTISGRITDAVTTSPVAGVSVLIEGTQRGTTAAADGSAPASEPRVECDSGGCWAKANAATHTSATNNKDTRRV